MNVPMAHRMRNRHDESGHACGKKKRSSPEFPPRVTQGDGKSRAGRSVAQRPLQDLSRRPLGQAVEDLYEAGVFISGEPVLAEGL